MLLLLVDDETAEFSSGAKDGAPRPHHDVGTAVLYHLPLEQTLGVVQGRVLDGHPPPEPALETEDHLRRQADLRHQHEARRPSARHRSMSFKNTSVLPLPVTP